MTEHLIAPHGGKLCNLVVADDTAEALKSESGDVLILTTLPGAPSLLATLFRAILPPPCLCPSIFIELSHPERAEGGLPWIAN